MKKAVFLTCGKYPDISDSDRLTVPYLTSLGISVTAVPWTRRGVDWGQYDAVVMRSGWDYYRHYGRFLEFLGDLESAGTALWNPPGLMRWNSHKSYKLDLAGRGIAVTPMVLWQRGRTDVTQDINRLPSDRVVVKPAVGLSAFGVSRHDKSDVTGIGKAVRRIHRQSDAVVESYLPDVETAGESSFVFIGGEFTHHVRKIPKAGDFRAQPYLGSREFPEEADPDYIRQARTIIRSLPVTLYARVDGIVTGGRLLLVELELIEPHLFFDLYPDSAGKFAGALAGLIKSG
ncbi:hypothetical protein A2Z33_00465 [Candidatus Gottesmanbacteria bacterium RBG_16_52_11]|uniref:ATP-grasp domain-containing protein n=1 Tax=Candidatus Gottesmanbacteria bacterium RBG_16_52_11 TaxID=1798374 RepID=A0A1F5YMT9_9BACT|nr:MAG: hypothetical protein A2Z33_00465 [Candidatus Gottesmanbacteria bacterium RBG_16_52_11]